nr:putative pentatricopeptide repeat-containing protein At1g12700, mitochondrial [Malus domestica]
MMRWATTAARYGSRRLGARVLQRRHLPSVVRFNQILGQVARLKHYSTVISLNNQMGMSGIRPDVYTLNIIINCCCHLNQMGFGLSILGKFFKLSFEPHVTTFNTLINGFLLEDRKADAVGILNKIMESGNWKPTAVTFAILVKGLCMKGNNIGAIQLLNKMEEGDCKPNMVIYSTIIDSLCKDTLIVDALNLFSKMTSKGIAPDVITYTCLIHGVCKLGEWKESIRLLNEMVR